MVPDDSILASGATGAAPAKESPLSEDAALALLRRHDLPASVIQSIAQQGELLKNPKIRVALAEHPQAPRHISMPLVRRLFTFDLMRVALAPTAASEIRLAAEDALITRLETISAGEKMSLARRASGRVAGALLRDPDRRVMRTALDNSRLTETILVKALMAAHASEALVEAVCSHQKWHLRRDVQIALLMNARTPEAQALRLARFLPPQVARNVIDDSHLPEAVKLRLRQEIG